MKRLDSLGGEPGNLRRATGRGGAVRANCWAHGCVAALVVTSRLLAKASAQRARLVILDIAAVGTIDTVVARGLLNITQALRRHNQRHLAQCGNDAGWLDFRLENVATARSLREALAGYLVDR